MVSTATSPGAASGGLLVPRIVTLLVWLAAAASIAYWGLRLTGPAGSLAPVAVAGSSLPTADAQAIGRVLGATSVVVQAAPVAAPTRFVLTGVVADRRQGGAALIAIDGKPPRPYRVGAAVEQGLVLKAVTARRAELAGSMSAPASITLELPPLKN